MNADEWLLAFPPDCRQGYSTRRLRTVLGGSWRAFESFMTGRSYTSEAGPDGRIVAVAYLDDVWRFVAGPEAPLPEPAQLLSGPSSRAARLADIPPDLLQRVRFQLDEIQRSVASWLMAVASTMMARAEAVRPRGEPAAPGAAYASSQPSPRLLAHR
jgi:hypothetical protein